VSRDAGQLRDDISRFVAGLRTARLAIVEQRDDVAVVRFVDAGDASAR
jgi:hypothetical protein